MCVGGNARDAPYGIRERGRLTLETSGPSFASARDMCCYVRERIIYV